MSKKTWTVYTLRCSKERRARYVGVTCTSLAQRLRCHREHARHEAWPAPVHRWMRAVYDAGGMVEIWETETFDNEKMALAAERERIGRTRGIHNTRWKGDYKPAPKEPQRPWNESPGYNPGDISYPLGHTWRLASRETIQAGSPRNVKP